jgi:hypothetical protein
MEYAATIQSINNTELALEFELPKAAERTSEEAEVDRTVENILFSTAMGVPSFQIGSMLGQSIVHQIGQLTCVQEAAAFLLTFYALTTIGVMFYAAQKKSTLANLSCSAALASILGCLSYLSLS